MHRPSIARLAQYGGFVAELPPLYLAPSLHFSMTRSSQSSSFSTTPVAAGRGRDMNRTRGVSAIHRTGTRFKLSASKYPLPKPVSPEPQQTPDHGLWGFFPKSREAMSAPEFDMDHGRSWAVQELREKSWDDLHKLWWVCVKERNRIATTNMERERMKAGYGEHEASARDRAVQITQKSIKHVLRERWYAWEDAKHEYFTKKYRPQHESAMEEETFESSPKP
ncbi:hypothetical protein N7523_009925 [Penicillium sp. IBT 18751x]|nr:hypothetical protein N7523_009925 [Penicillium sp. IBT 18751x]